MGREIRRVPKGWQHPVNDVCRHIRHEGPCYRPCYNKEYEIAAQEWIAEFDQWRAGTHADQQGKYASKEKHFWDFSPPPDDQTYRPAFESEPVCYQIYETVSEGTPVSPVFETEEDIVQWLIGQGTRESAARSFVQAKWVSSMIMFSSKQGVEIRTGIDAADWTPSAG